MFRTVIDRFNEYISEYSYTSHALGEQEYVYEIANSIIIHISSATNPRYHIVMIEIFNEGLYDLKLKQFEYQSEGYILHIFPYKGNLSLSNPRVSNLYDRIKRFVPNINLPDRDNSKRDSTIRYLVFELTENGTTGYAACATTAKQTMKRVISVGEDLLFACLEAKNRSTFADGSSQYFNGSGLKYHFSLDRTMITILLNRLTGKTDARIKKNLSPEYLGLEESGLRFCWIVARIKNPDDHISGNIIDDVKRGYYDDVDRYDFVLPDNKWKSEQLVYELVKQLYPNGNVWYQFRPSFLFSGKGQLSYDVYLAKYRIAIEYQGKQHFEPVELFGGKEAFTKQQQRDELKAQLSKDHGVKLIYINYWEDITSDLIKHRIEEALNTE